MPTTPYGWEVPIVAELSIPCREAREINHRIFFALTNHVNFEEEEIIRSIWQTLRHTEAFATIDPLMGVTGGIQFWRKKLKKTEKHYFMNNVNNQTRGSLGIYVSGDKRPYFSNRTGETRKRRVH
jgi:hypothetical protein